LLIQNCKHLYKISIFSTPLCKPQEKDEKQVHREIKLTIAHLLARNSLIDIAFWLYIIGDAQ